jgi:phosphoribosylformimino-5-aminoimidazole carboxamide ribotide isomerase
MLYRLDSEGLMHGINIEAVLAIRRATERAVTAAGGISTQEEVAQLEAFGVDAVVGMAIYTGAIEF